MSSRGLIWFNALTHNINSISNFIPSVKVVDKDLGGKKVRFIVVVKDKNNHYPRSRNGEVGLLEGWYLAKAVQEKIAQDHFNKIKTPIIAIIDVPSQAYGRREEAYGIHLSLAAAVNAYVQARLAGHPVLGLIVGKAMSGGFLAHGYQASRLIGLNDENCMVHAMGKASAARITLRTIEQLEALSSSIPPMAYDINSFSSLGLLWKLINVEKTEVPTSNDITLVEHVLIEALEDIKENGNDLTGRIYGEHRKETLNIRQQMERLW